MDRLKEKCGDKLPPVRINTNGHANLINGRDVCPELKGRIDTLSISLNNDNAADYAALFLFLAITVGVGVLGHFGL